MKSRAIDFFVGGIDGFIRHNTRRHAALLAYYGFLSVFPLFVVMTTILGYVLENRPKFRAEVVDSVYARLPFIGDQLKSNPSQLKGSLLVLIFGVLTTLWAATRAFVAAQHGMNEIWEVPQSDRPGLAGLRARALLAIVVVGVAQVGSVIVTSLVSVSGTSWVTRILLVIAAIAINVTVLVAAYVVLTARRSTWHQLWPGALAAGIGFSVLQVIGTTVVQRAIRSATPIYGNFATVIALLSWLSLHATLALIGVEANAALHRRRHPMRARARA